MKARKKVIQGGTSSGKTYGIIPIIIDWAAKNPRKRITIVAESIPAVRDGAVKIFEDVMYDTGRWIQSHWIGNPMEYTFQNKTVVQFKSFDSLGKAKASGKRDMLFLNEANHIPFDIADALMIRSKQTWIDFNPDAEFWVHKETLLEPNSEFLLLTYEDNEAIPPETLEDIHIKISKAFHDVDGNWEDDKNIKNHYWANWVKVYVSGEIGSLQGVVFSDWERIENIPQGYKLEAYGLDWGYSNDPTALTEIWSNGESFIYNELIYETEMLNSDIINRMKELNVSRSVRIFADSSEPKSIRELKNAGFKMIPAYKPAGSIKYGIDKMQRKPFFVTKNSVNLIYEFQNYTWAKDRFDNATNKPIDNHNHAIDGIRYYHTERDKYNAVYR